MRLRVATINVGGIKNGWQDGRREVLIDGLRDCQPDIVCLQEATLCRGFEVYDQASDIGEAIDLPVRAFTPYGNPIEIISHDQGGVAVLSRWPIEKVRNRRLPGAHENPPDARVALFVTLRTPGGNVAVVTTHLSWEPEYAQIRLMQMGMILDDLFRGRTLPENPVLLMGDFNAVESEPAIHLALERFEDSYRKLHPNSSGYTWVTKNPLTGLIPIADRRLDYIFCSAGTKIRTAEVMLDRPKPSYASDHFGVFSELEWEIAA